MPRSSKLAVLALKKTESLKDILMKKVSELEAQKKADAIIVGLEEEQAEIRDRAAVKNASQDR